MARCTVVACRLVRALANVVPLGRRVTTVGGEEGAGVRVRWFFLIPKRPLALKGDPKRALGWAGERWSGQDTQHLNIYESIKFINADWKSSNIDRPTACQFRDPSGTHSLSLSLSHTCSLFSYRTSWAVSSGAHVSGLTYRDDGGVDGGKEVREEETKNIWPRRWTA